jgi:hypothetical protein
VLIHLTLLLVRLGIIDTSKDLKYTGVTTAGAWASGGNLNTARSGMFGGIGTQTAALAAGGWAPNPTGATEEYDGTSWANNPTGLNTARAYLAGCGIQTAALGFWWLYYN